MDKEKFAGIIFNRLAERYGRNLHTELSHKNMTELFVAVFLSPQCSDKQINRITPKLFRRFRTFHDYANADIRTLMRYLNGVNYYKTKARNLKKASKMIEERFGGNIPKTIEELMELPGIGRKVANVILNEGFGINQGIAIDTHCITVVGRLKLSRHRDPKKIENDIMGIFPEEEWGEISNLLITLGRDVCTAREKRCGRCVLADICPSSEVLEPDKENHFRRYINKNKN